MFVYFYNSVLWGCCVFRKESLHGLHWHSYNSGAYMTGARRQSGAPGHLYPHGALKVGHCLSLGRHSCLLLLQEDSAAALHSFLIPSKVCSMLERVSQQTWGLFKNFSGFAPLGG